ncbi:MAG TPA: DUF1206 domain-containing protein [Vicinamibacterales bacterium]|nr:DUF1206 domain-containing protein [Vicinamibacterales bacterium]
MDRFSRIVARLGRAGFATRAVLYVWMGLQAVRLAVVSVGRPDFAGTFAAAAATGGAPLLIAMAIGLCGYALWRWAEALRNPEGRSVWSRSDIAARGALHAWLAVTALRTAMAHRAEPRPVWQSVMAASGCPLGKAAVFGAGIFMLWFAWNEARLARRGLISRHLDDDDVSDEGVAAIQWVGRAGMAGRAAAFGLVAAALIMSSFEPVPSTSVDLADILTGVSKIAAGRFMVLAIGAGLSAYGVYLAVLAWRRRMPA